MTSAFCLSCSRAAVKRFISLESDYPDLASDYDTDKNRKSVTEIGVHSKTPVYWKCHNCGKGWLDSPCKRVLSSKSKGCPHCHESEQNSRVNHMALMANWLIIQMSL
ncbi:zinc-ribbon domain-containing protein [Pseudocolwellia sp. AS88]|uniref:zinc-ribbon domain-containing protein n=1 Tax=Pseudocolwellia sp. AS88 TaxID=3063958 RepID=UPI0026F36E10|nr:zinc-ribbon domain-containing protein [Pseudocolwellia sp. AS88]MDO7085527.1 zinc-ribbon domain-containing protein [Pseudocolwellia sp. AS88]